MVDTAYRPDRARRSVLPDPKSRRSARCLVVAALALSVASTAVAQSLAELYAMARPRDTALRAAEAERRATVFSAEQARALNRPGLTLDASSGRQDQSTPYLQPLRTQGTTHGATLTATVPVFNRANDVQIRQATLVVASADEAIRAAEQNLMLRVAQAYFDLLTAQRQLQAILASKAAVELALAAARKAFDVGTVSITDTREAESRFDLVIAQEVAAIADVKNAQAVLGLLVGRDDLTLIEAPKPATSDRSEAPPLSWWLDQARTSEPNLLNARRAVEYARLDVELARAGHLPTVSLTGSLVRRYQSLDYRYDGSVAGLPGRQSGWGTNQLVGVQLSVPLYSGRSIENRVLETLQREDRALSEAEGVERNNELNARQAWLAVQSSRARVTALRAAESSSQLALRATRRGFEAGLRVTVDVLNAQTQLLQTQRDLARAEHDVHLSELRLLRAAGLISPDDLRLTSLRKP